MKINEYLSYGFADIIYFLLFHCGDRLYTSESDVYRRQILTYKDGPCADMVKHMAILFVIICIFISFQA